MIFVWIIWRPATTGQPVYYWTQIKIESRCLQAPYSDLLYANLLHEFNWYLVSSHPEYSRYRGICAIANHSS